MPSTPEDWGWSLAPRKLGMMADVCHPSTSEGRELKATLSNSAWSGSVWAPSEPSLTKTVPALVWSGGFFRGPTPCPLWFSAHLLSSSHCEYCLPTGVCISLHTVRTVQEQVDYTVSIYWPQNRLGFLHEPQNSSELQSCHCTDGRPHRTLQVRDLWHEDCGETTCNPLLKKGAGKALVSRLQQSSQTYTHSTQDTFLQTCSWRLPSKGTWTVSASAIKQTSLSWSWHTLAMEYLCLQLKLLKAIKEPSLKEQSHPMVALWKAINNGTENKRNPPPKNSCFPHKGRKGTLKSQTKITFSAEEPSGSVYFQKAPEKNLSHSDRQMRPFSLSK